MHRLPADILQQPIVLTLSFSLSGQTAEDLLPDTLKQEVAPRPRHARVNTLKTSVEAATAWLESPPAEHAQHAKQVCNSVIMTVEACLDHLHDAESAKIVTRAGSVVQADWAQRDGLLRDVLVFPPSTDLHDHPLVSDRSLILQVSMLMMVLVLAASVNITMYACSASVQRHRRCEHGDKMMSPRA